MQEKSLFSSAHNLTEQRNKTRVQSRKCQRFNHRPQQALSLAAQAAFSLSFSCSKQQSLCVFKGTRVRFESRPLTIAATTADASGANNVTDNRGSVISPAHWRIPDEDVILPVQSPPGTQQRADRDSAWREIKEKSRFSGIVAVAAAREPVIAKNAGDRWADAWTKQPERLQRSEHYLMKKKNNNK